MFEIKTYNEFENFIKAFSTKKLNLLIVLSRGGLGKTFLTEECLMEQAPLFISGHITPLKLYIETYERTQEEKDFILVFDDVDSLFSSKDIVALLKQLSDTREEKNVRYFTTSSILKEYPSEFETSCKVIILMNAPVIKDPNIEALMTRAHLVYFNPSNTEILKYMKPWAEDAQVFEFVKKFAPFSKSLSLRTYKQAEELKNSGLDWKAKVVDELDIDARLFLIHTLLKNDKTDKEREELFAKKGGGSRPTYYRFKKLYLSKTK